MHRLPAAALLVATLSTLGCHDDHPKHHEGGKFLVTHPLRKDTERTRDYVAQIHAIQHIELRALERGYLHGIFVDEGQPVSKGAKMFQLMPRILQAELDKTKAEAELAEIELRNTKLLAEKNIVSANELAMAKARVDKARAEVSLASTHRAFTEIRAPFDGLMGRFHVRLGSLVDEGEVLTTLSDNRRVWAYFNVSESEYLDYQRRTNGVRGEQVRLVMANGQMFDHVGRVDTIGAEFNHETGNVAFRATFENPDGLLRHGETGKVLMNVPLPNALVIPQKATFDVLDRKFVYVVGEDHVVHSRPISVSAEQPQLYVVASGLDEKDTIVVEGLRKVREGAVIETEFQKPAELIGSLEVPAE